MYLDDVMLFTEGDCHILALELERISGGEWRLAVVGDKHDDFHAVVVNRQGDVLDVEGKHTIEKIKEVWNAERLELVDKKHLEEKWDFAPHLEEGHMFNNSRQRAQEIAPKILEGTYDPEKEYKEKYEAAYG